MRDTGVGVHIVSFDIPFPANYGGVIDVYYKIRALHRAGVLVHLHCYQYHRDPAPELLESCASVRYYPRQTGIRANISLLPYIVASRMSEELIGHLLQDDHPILFEGLHTCGIMADPRLKGRILVYRESNIEHHYYYHLFRAEKEPGRKLYFLAESARLKRFQQILRNATAMLAVSKDDTEYLAGRFPSIPVHYLPSFHRDDKVDAIPGKGNYALYQGKLSVPENSVAARYLVTEVWEESYPDLILAGADPPTWLKKLAAGRPNIRLVENPGDEEMFRLIREAHVNVMVTFQPTGLKLKLLNALFNGRFCLVNPAMVAGTGLAGLCTVADGAPDLKRSLSALFGQQVTAEELARRDLILREHYSNEQNCKKLMAVIHL